MINILTKYLEEELNQDESVARIHARKIIEMFAVVEAAKESNRLQKEEVEKWNEEIEKCKGCGIERKSVCCGAISRSLEHMNDLEFVCSKCGKEFIGGKCTNDKDIDDPMTDSDVIKRFEKLLDHYCCSDDCGTAGVGIKDLKVFLFSQIKRGKNEERKLMIKKISLIQSINPDNKFNQGVEWIKELMLDILK